MIKFPISTTVTSTQYVLNECLLSEKIQKNNKTKNIIYQNFSRCLAKTVLKVKFIALTTSIIMKEGKKKHLAQD